MQEQDIIELLLQRNGKGMDALLLHYGPLMRYIIAPICKSTGSRGLPFRSSNACLGKIEQFNQERGSWKTWLTAITRNAALNYTRDTHRHNSVEEIPDGTPSPEPSPEELIIQKNGNLRLIMLCASYRPRTGCCFTENIITYNQQPKLLPSWG